jgi:hypothetical protein
VDGLTTSEPGVVVEDADDWSMLGVNDAGDGTDGYVVDGHVVNTTNVDRSLGLNGRWDGADISACYTPIGTSIDERTLTGMYGARVDVIYDAVCTGECRRLTLGGGGVGRGHHAGEVTWMLCNMLSFGGCGLRGSGDVMGES